MPTSQPLNYTQETAAKESGARCYALISTTGNVLDVYSVPPVTIAVGERWECVIWDPITGQWAIVDPSPARPVSLVPPGEDPGMISRKAERGSGFAPGITVRVISSPSGRYTGQEGTVTGGESVVRVVFPSGAAASFWHEDLERVAGEGA